jgi:hypothetical protein
MAQDRMRVAKGTATALVTDALFLLIAIALLFAGQFIRTDVESPDLTPIFQLSNWDRWFLLSGLIVFVVRAISLTAEERINPEVENLLTTRSGLSVRIGSPWRGGE